MKRHRYDEFCELIGEDDAAMVCATYGGHKVVFSKPISFVRPESLAILQRHYGRESIYVPVARKHRAALMFRQDFDLATVAAALHISLRRAEQMYQEFRAAQKD